LDQRKLPFIIYREVGTDEKLGELRKFSVKLRLFPYIVIQPQGWVR